MQRSVWGWGYEGVEVPQLEKTRQMLETIFPKPTFRLPKPNVELWKSSLRKPRFPEPKIGTCEVSHDPKERMMHSFGKSFRDIARGVLGQYGNVVDYVAFPTSEVQVQEVLEWGEKMAQDGTPVDLIPFGGGSSVVGGVEPLIDSKRVVSIDLSRMDKIISVNLTDMTAQLQTGIFGPALLRGLTEYDKITLRHLPQSLSFSTLGGWLATRSGGHYASNKTYIDDFVVNMTIVTSKGIVKTSNLPASGAGPVADKIWLGSEGTLGIITECTVRVQKEPTFKCSSIVTFDSWDNGVNATRLISQSGLYPTQCRLMQGMEAIGYGLIQDFVEACLVLGFESATIDGLEERFMQPCLDICLENQGTILKTPKKDESATDTFRNSFITAPYLRDHLIMDGYIMETFETACSWSNFPKLDEAVRAAVASLGKPVMLTVRFTHVYPDGPAPYYTLTTQASSPTSLVSDWDALKQVVSDALIANGGTITHHHAVGKDHAQWFVKEKDPIWIAMLVNLKGFLDPQGMLNRGTLLPSKLLKDFKSISSKI
jgi:alkyldihydroxyacetonephosphate synthase